MTRTARTDDRTERLTPRRRGPESGHVTADQEVPCLVVGSACPATGIDSPQRYRRLALLSHAVPEYIRPGAAVSGRERARGGLLDKHVVARARAHAPRCPHGTRAAKCPQEALCHGTGRGLDEVPQWSAPKRLATVTYPRGRVASSRTSEVLQGREGLGRDRFSRTSARRVGALLDYRSGGLPEPHRGR